MAFKLTKSERAQHEAHVTALRDARETLDAAAKEYNSAVQIAFAAFSEAAMAYNEVLADAEEWVEGIAGRMLEECDEKSEAWQNSPRGEEAREIVNEWADWMPEEIEIVEPAPLELGDDDADALAELPGVEGE